MSISTLILPVSLELGGKSPVVVFDDVDIDKAIEWTLYGSLRTNGQICWATSHLLIHTKIAKEFTERMVAWARNIKVSNTLEKGCRLGPVVSEEQYEKMNKFVANAKNEGAIILTGGVRPKHLKHGYYIEPTVITNVSTSMEIWREEVFGPVICVKEFSSEHEAIALANDTNYGLVGAVLSADHERCQRVAKDINAGAIWVNCLQPSFCQARGGGNKRSGFVRELGERALDMYLSVKHITEYTSDEPCGWYQPPKAPFGIKE